MNKQAKQEQRLQRQQLKQQQLRAARTRRYVVFGVIAAVVLAVAISVFLYIQGQRSSAQGKATNTGSITNAPNTQPGGSVDGIACDQQEGNILHYHAHVSIYVNGSPVQVPANVGIENAGTCFYWMHTHDNSGIIHIEAPGHRSFTLGNFFHIWSEQFPQLQYPLQLDGADGWKVYVDGKLYTGDFHSINLQSHMLITLAYNSPSVQPDTTYNWGDLTQ